MCDDKTCEKRKTCYRFMGIPNNFRQTYFLTSPKEEERCDEYFPIPKGAKIRNEMDTR